MFIKLELFSFFSTEITCPSPNVPNAYWTGNHNQRFQYRATIYIECNMGYVMSGPGTVYCERDGRWLPGLPKCQRRRKYSVLFPGMSNLKYCSHTKTMIAFFFPPPQVLSTGGANSPACKP